MMYNLNHFLSVKIQLVKFTTSIFKVVRVYGTIHVMNITEVWLLRRGGEEAPWAHHQRRITRKKRKKMVVKRTRYKREP